MRAMPGTVPRNGMPPSKDYVYGGLGYDQLNPGPSIGGLRKRGIEVERQPAAELPGNTRVIPEAAPRPVPEPVTVARTALAICPACDADLCDTCFGGPCRCACIDYVTPAFLASAPEPVTPERCEVCGYLMTAPGHLLSCGSPDAGRILRLADAIGGRPCGS